VLVVSTGPSFAAKWLAPRLFSFMDEHPEIEVRISANLKLVDFSRDGIDVGIRFGEGNYPGLETRWLIGDELTVLGSPQFLADHAISSPQDIPAHPLIIDDSLSFNPKAPTWEKWLEMAGVLIGGSVRGVHFNHADHAIDAAVRGTGLVLARTSLSRADRDTGLLVELFPDLRISTDMAFYLVMPPMAGSKPKVQAFTNWILRELDLEEDAPPLS
jgi:LysR family glycine cleavage system transcriptional activator